MKINPVLSHGLRSRMRGARAMVLMVIYLTITLAIFLLVYASSDISNMMKYGGGYFPYENQSANNGLFAALAIIQFILIAMVVPAMNAGSISGERERQTLDLLLCSRLSAIRIVIGKLGSNVIFVAFLIVLTTPLFAVVYICGGLTLFDVAKLLLFYFACAYVCASIATMFSGLFKKTALATICTYIVLILFVVLTLIMGIMQMNAQYEAAMLQYSMSASVGPFSQVTVPFLLRINPLMVLMESIPSLRNMMNVTPFYMMARFDFTMQTQTGSFWYAILFYLAISVVLNVVSAIAIKPVKKCTLR